MPPTTRGACRENLDAYKQVLASNAEAVSGFGGRLAVLYTFIDAALPHLSVSQRREIAYRFRQGVADVRSFGDDLILSAAYQEALLNKTSVLLIAAENASNIKYSHSRSSADETCGQWRRSG
ncbi:hypothetical protein [Paraburkholderia sp. JHI869]|uniref:hypothetical protein n=1 Tax=Paraburkholderia sp. JHI869 TaxID=3112959 RepID=UPI0031771CB9